MTENEMTREKALSDIQTIKNFLEEGQKNLGESGFLFMVWGVLIPIATPLYYFLRIQFPDNAFLASAFWPIAMILGGAMSVGFGSRSEKRSRAKGYAEKINGQMWIGFLVSLGIVIPLFLLGSREVTPVFLSVIALLLGLAYWVHGSMIQLAWFRLVAIAWWGTAIFVARMTWPLASITMAGATFVCSFIPGLILYRRYARSK